MEAHSRTMTIHYFNCSKCSKQKAQSLKKEHADAGLCRTCRAEVKKVAPGQTRLFEEEKPNFSGLVTRMKGVRLSA